MTRRINASPASVYRALIDARAVEKWRVPDGMSSNVHTFDAREGGGFRISLTYEDPSRAGKTAGHTDTYHGYFQRLVPNRQVVEVVEFETTDFEMLGEMTITTTLEDIEGCTEVSVVYGGLPEGVSEADNEAGTAMALSKLAALVEAD